MVKNFFRKFWPLILIVILAFALRVYKLGDYPVGLTWDEPALGYNAYSILKTGRDEYGKLFPITFKSFGDYKPGLFIYYLIPSVGIFGLNEFAIRFPSALAGVGTVLAVFFLVKIIFEKRKEVFSLAFLSSLLLAVSPWNIHFSRGAWEANLALFTIVVGVIFFLRSIKDEKIKWFFPAFIFFAFSFYVYHGAKVFLVVFLGGSLLFLFKDLRRLPQEKKIIGLILLFFLLIPLFTSFKGSSNRAKVMSIFSYKRPEEEINKILSQEEGKNLNFFLYHSEILETGRGILSRYFNHFSARFLFFEGDWASPRHSVPYMGMMYFVEIPFLILGIGYFLATKKNPFENLLIWWLLTGPLPAAITRDAVHGIRSYWMVVPLVIFTSLGILRFFSLIKAYWPKFFLPSVSFIFLVYIFCLILYLDLYYVHFPKKNSSGWNYGMKEVAKIIEEGKSKYSKIIMTQKYGQPYIFYLFYNQYPPKNYQQQAYLKENPWGDVGKVERIDNIEFRNVYWPDDRNCQNCLFIDDELGLPEKDISQTSEAKILREIKFLDGRIAYRIVEKK